LGFGSFFGALGFADLCRTGTITTCFDTDFFDIWHRLRKVTGSEF